MIQQYPTHTTEFQRPRPPASLSRAAIVMYAGALLCATHSVVYVLTAGAEKATLRRKVPTMSAHHLATLTDAVVSLQAVAALIGAVAFVWIARACLKGRNGARVTGTVFFAITALATAYNFVSPEVTVNRMLMLAGVVFGLAAVVLLWRRSSNAYFAAFKRPQA
jgi:hypothetical protein